MEGKPGYTLWKWSGSRSKQRLTAQVMRAYLLLAVLRFPPNLVAVQGRGFLTLLPRAFWHDVAMNEAFKILPRPVFSTAACVCMCAKGAVVLRILPWLSLEAAHDTVVGRQHRCVLRCIIQAAGYRIHVARQAAENGDVLRLPDHI